MAYRTTKNTPEGRLPADYEEITVKPDFEGKMKDVEDGLDSMNEILEKLEKTQLKKAGGGLAYMLQENNENKTGTTMQSTGSLALNLTAVAL